MSVYIVVHERTVEDAMNASKFIFERLDAIFPGKPRSCYDGRFITMGNGIDIDFRCGTNTDKLGGIRPNYYYTDDSDYVADMLEMGACKVNGKKLGKLCYVIHIVSLYMLLNMQIDDWLENTKKGEKND